MDQKNLNHLFPNLVNQNISAIIGGTGFNHLAWLINPSLLDVETPFGKVTGITKGWMGDQQVVFMLRHGAGHKLPPHKINYRANIWALKTLGVAQVIAVNAVGGIDGNCSPGAIVIPDQLIDYTYGREHTFADVLSDDFNHIEFANPYSDQVRQALITAAAKLGLTVVDGGCYACTQGPRLETAAEITRLKRDGNDVVGMTAMPEAALARELGIDYGAICIVSNWAAGLCNQAISMAEILKVLKITVDQVQDLMAQVLLHEERG